MPLNKSKGNMYDWVSHTWSPVTGCGHQCSYCYMRKWAALESTPRIRDDFPALGTGRTIFVGHTTDLFAENVPSTIIEAVISHTQKYPENVYVWQTKNPARLVHWWGSKLPAGSIVGTTIETNRAELLASVSNAPAPDDRARGIAELKHATGLETFVTIEPVMDFDVQPFGELIWEAMPTWVNIGADSKGHGLQEPDREKIEGLARFLDELAHIPIRKKINLDRLYKRTAGRQSA